MIYKDITIEKFRGIKSLPIKDLGRVNLFVGKNNSGKTSVLEAIFLITGISNPQLAISIDLFRELVHNEADDFRFIFYGLDYLNEPKLEALLYSRTVRTLNIQPTLTTRVNSSDSSIEISKTSASTSDLNLSSDGIVFNFSIKAYHSRVTTHKSTLSFEGRTFKQEPAKNYKETLAGVFISSNFSNAADLPARLERIIVEKRKSDIIEILKIVDQNIKDIIIGVNNMIYLDIGLNKYIPTNMQGDGLNKLLKFITAIYYNKDGLIFIDEIENGFHYKIFRSLWKAIIKAAQVFNVQLFITTHNYELITQLKNALDDQEMESERANISTYSLIRNQDNISAIRYDYSQFENAISAGLEIR